MEFDTTFNALNMNRGVNLSEALLIRISKRKSNCTICERKCKCMTMQSDTNCIGLVGCNWSNVSKHFIYSFRFASTSFKTGSWHIVSPGGCRLGGALFAPSPPRPKFGRGDGMDRGIMQRLPLHIAHCSIAQCTLNIA